MVCLRVSREIKNRRATHIQLRRSPIDRIRHLQNDLQRRRCKEGIIGTAIRRVSADVRDLAEESVDMLSDLGRRRRLCCCGIAGLYLMRPRTRCKRARTHVGAGCPDRYERFDTSVEVNECTAGGEVEGARVHIGNESCGLILDGGHIGADEGVVDLGAAARRQVHSVLVIQSSLVSVYAGSARALGRRESSLQLRS